MTLSAESNWTVHVDGDVPKPLDWSASRLRGQAVSQVRPVQYTFKEQQHTSDCIPLIALIKAAGVQTELKVDPKATPAAKHPNTRLIVEVHGRDGFTAVFCLAELMPEVGNRPAYLALDVDGQPLGPHHGPVKLIVPHDEKPVRWVHGVRSISVVDATTSTARTGGA